MARLPALDRTSPPRRLRALAILALLALSIVLAIDGIAWLRLEHRLHQRLQAFAADGLDLRYGTARRGGWPFSATLLLDSPSVTGPDASDMIDWSGERIAVTLSLLHPSTLHLELHGTQSLRLGALSLKFWSADFTVSNDGDRTMLSADALHLARQGAGPDDVVQIAGLLGELHWRPTQPGGTDLALTLRDVAIPLGIEPADGRVIQRVRLAATLEGQLPTTVARWPDVLSDWRSHGGALRLDEASLDWNRSGAALTGRAIPDDDGTLGGAFTLDLTHPGQALATLTRGGLIGAGQATAILAVIGLVADAESLSGPDPQIHLPLTLRHGRLSLGQIPLLSLQSPPATPH